MLAESQTPGEASKQKPMLITRKAEFSASHACYLPGRSPEDNRRIFGEAANPLGHGHNYVLEVTLEGEPDPVTGMILDLKHVKEVIQREVIEPFDHRFLNHEVPPFDKVVPTAENVAIEIWKRLERHFPRRPGGSAPPQAALYNIRLYETEDHYVDYCGD
jgi:6-pyruvoyltetrahydropterin/6-carboxytetrahydropterin synthase